MKALYIYSVTRTCSTCVSTCVIMLNQRQGKKIDAQQEHKYLENKHEKLRSIDLSTLCLFVLLLPLEAVKTGLGEPSWCQEWEPPPRVFIVRASFASLPCGKRISLFSYS